MKRAALLYCADVEPSRFKLLKQRDQLPFFVADNDEDSKWADYSLEDAFRLRLMLDLVDDTNKDRHPTGLGPKFACDVVGSAGSYTTCAGAMQSGPALWAGAICFAATRDDEIGEEWRIPFCAPLGSIGATIAKEVSDYGAAYREISPVRIFIANATRAAEFVVQRATELGLPESQHLPQAKSGTE